MSPRRTGASCVACSAPSSHGRPLRIAHSWARSGAWPVKSAALVVSALQRFCAAHSRRRRESRAQAHREAVLDERGRGPWQAGGTTGAAGRRPRRRAERRQAVSNSDGDRPPHREVPVPAGRPVRKFGRNPRLEELLHHGHDDEVVLGVGDASTRPGCAGPPRTPLRVPRLHQRVKQMKPVPVQRFNPHRAERLQRTRYRKRDFRPSSLNVLLKPQF